MRDLTPSPAKVLVRNVNILSNYFITIPMKSRRLIDFRSLLTGADIGHLGGLFGICRLMSLFLAAALAGCATNQTEPKSSEDTELKIQRLKSEQEELLISVKRQLDSLEESPRKEAFRERVAEIERRIRLPDDLYLSSRQKMTTEMQAYHAKLLRRIEDCGTRNFPVRNGKSVYGAGVMAITLEKDGNALKAEVIEPSQDSMLDSSVVKAVFASSPFGRLPEQMTVDPHKPYNNLVLTINFEFHRNNEGAAELNEGERCRWPQ